MTHEPCDDHDESHRVAVQQLTDDLESALERLGDAWGYIEVSYQSSSGVWRIERKATRRKSLPAETYHGETFPDVLVKALASMEGDE